MTEPLKVDLGCGQNKREGFKGADIAPCEGVDFVLDLFSFPWPWVDGSVAEVHCSHFFEHVPARLRFRWMDELYRVLVPGGQASIIVPYYASMRAVQDPTHEWPPLAESSFLYFNAGWRKAQKLDHYPVKCDFDFSYGYAPQPEWMNRNEQARAFAFAHYINVVNDLLVTLTKRQEPTNGVPG